MFVTLRYRSGNGELLPSCSPHEPFAQRRKERFRVAAEEARYSPRRRQPLSGEPNTNPADSERIIQIENDVAEQLAEEVAELWDGQRSVHLAVEERLPDKPVAVCISHERRPRERRIGFEALARGDAFAPELDLLAVYFHQ